MDTPYYVNLSGASDNTLLQFYCLNPPSVSCEFGPCPNPDVTGIGQQVSLYITSTVFGELTTVIWSQFMTFIFIVQAITIIHNPKDFKLSFYSFLANVYSLLISALISMVKVELTQNDAIFVLIATVSPATLYLWIIAAYALFGGLPRRIARRIPDTHEQILLVALSFMSFALWITMVGLVLKPSSRVRFSQPGCNKTYRNPQLLALSWSPIFLSQSLLTGVIIFGVVLYLRHQTQKQTVPPSRNHIASANLLRWTRMSLETDFGHLGTSPHRVAAILLVMQISYVPPAGFRESVMVGVILGPLSLILIWMSPRRFQSPKQFLVRILLTLAVGGIMFLNSRSYITVYVLDLVNAGCVSVIWCNRVAERLAGQSYKKITFYRSLFIMLLLCTLAVQLFPLGTFIPRWFIPQLWWFCAWEICSFAPSSSIWENVALLWSNIMDSAPLFKFLYLILGPTTLWVQATVTANPTKTNTMTFGQIFAVIVAAVSLISLIFTCHKNRQAIKNAVWTVEATEHGRTYIPMHTRHPAGPNIPNPSLQPVNDPVPRVALPTVIGLEGSSTASGLHRTDHHNPIRRSTK